MNIQVVYRHFWPDSPPYASMLRSILGTLAADGHKVTMLCEQPCYKPADRRVSAPALETVDGIAVVRLPRLSGIAGKALFPLRALGWATRRRLAGDRFDLVWTATIPPVVQGAVGRVIARLFGAGFLYHMQDLYPELGAHSGQWRSGGIIDRLLGWLEAGNRSRADRLVTLSDDMRVTAEALARPKGRLVVLNNFMLDDFQDGSPSSAPSTDPLPATREDDPVSLIFAGNIGNFQGLETLVDAMRIVAERSLSVRLTLMGDGAAKASLMAQAADLPGVRFEDHRPFNEAKPLIAAADVGVVSLQPGIYRYAFPSKTLTYYGLGVPSLVIVESHSALASEIVRSATGFVADADAVAIADAIERITRERHALPAMKARVIRRYDQELSRPAVLRQWSAMIASLADERDGPRAA